MATNEGNGRVPTPTSPGMFFTGDVFGDGSLLGIERRYTIPEAVSLNSSGTFNSAIQPASGVRLVVVAVMIDWPAQLTAQVDIAFEVTLAGSPLVGSADMTLNTFAVGLPTIHLANSTPAGNAGGHSPDGLSLVTSEGDGSTPVYRFGVTNSGGDVVTATVFYAPLFANNAC